MAAVDPEDIEAGGIETATSSASPSTLRAGRRLVLVALHLLVAVVLGVFSDVGTGWGQQWVYVAMAATPWVVLVFSAGRTSGLSWSPLGGALTLLTGLAGYYLWLHWGQGVSAEILLGNGFNGAVWLGLGAGVGALAGLVGGCTRLPQPWSDFAWAGVVAIPIIEALLLASYGTDPPVLSAVLIWSPVAIALVAWALRSGARARALAVMVPIACLVLWQVEVTIIQEVLGRRN